MFLSEYREFSLAPCLAGKKNLVSSCLPCCWNRACPWHASELVSFLVGLRTYQHPGIEKCARKSPDSRNYLSDRRGCTRCHRLERPLSHLGLWLPVCIAAARVDPTWGGQVSCECLAEAQHSGQHVTHTMHILSQYIKQQMHVIKYVFKWEIFVVLKCQNFNINIYDIVIHNFMFIRLY